MGVLARIAKRMLRTAEGGVSSKPPMGSGTAAEATLRRPWDSEVRRGFRGPARQTAGGNDAMDVRMMQSPPTISAARADSPPARQPLGAHLKRHARLAQSSPEQI